MNVNKLFKLLLGTGVYLLEQSDTATKSARNRAAGQIEDLRDAARDKYERASDRVLRASRAIRGEDSNLLGNTIYFVAGAAVGVGVGLIFAPASGEVTRSVIAGRVQDMGDRVRDQFSSAEARPTGTRG
ncbi:MAG TPA: YtxH domain-containing protein [Terriglobales bacterium]|nr:YtxH domain-containing protein [Terriglobales bacterium]